MTNYLWNLYTNAIRSGNYLKIARLRFLQPDGSTAFSVDNDPRQKHSGAFIRSGSLSVNLQNGTRRTATVQLADVDGAFDYNVNNVWFGTEIAVDMGILTGNGPTTEGEEIWFPQGVFRVDKATQNVSPNGVTMEYSLTDKWAGLDGTLNGTLESTYTVSEGTNIFSPIVTLLGLDRGDGEPYDREAPLFTEYYNGLTQKLQNGQTVPLTDAPYDMSVDSDDGTVADMILALCGAVNAWVGYDRSGRLRIDPSQDDILDEDKPVSWRFSLAEAQVTGLAYDYQIGDVYNDYIVLGYMTSDYVQPAARAVNEDPMSPVCVSRIGRRTKRDPQPNFATVRMCADYAEWKVKRTAILRSAVSVSCNQIFHLDENTIIEIVRTDKAGSPTERHLVQGFTLPFSGTDLMTIEAVSVHDFPTITVYTNEAAGGRLPPEYQEVEWIETTGTQKIDVMSIGNDPPDEIIVKTKIKWKFQYYRQLSGCDGGLYFGIVNGKYQIGQTGTTSTNEIASDINFDDIEVKYNVPNGTIEYKINGASGNLSRTWATFGANFSLFILGSQYACYCYAKTTEINSTKNGVTTTRELVPCYRKADSVVGMYDTVGNTFFTNAGTGTFTAGPNV